MKHFIFDLDGTLIDTEWPVLLTWQKTLEEQGHHFSVEELQIVLGVPTQAGLQRLGVVVDGDFGNNWFANYALFASKARFFPDAEALLMALKEKGAALGAVSSRSREEYRDYFSQFHLERFFDVVILEGDTVEHKPHPAPLLKYLEITGADPKDCIYIGDMPSDMACANAAGIASGFVTWNGSGRTCSQALYTFITPNELLALLLT